MSGTTLDAFNAGSTGLTKLSLMADKYLYVLYVSIVLTTEM